MERSCVIDLVTIKLYRKNINRLESMISSILKGLPEEEEVKLPKINQLSSFEEV